jgi:hypothetical protein
MQESIKKDYARLKELIAKDEILLLVNKRYEGIKKLLIYSRCGISMKYFENAYKDGKVLLEFRNTGLRVGAPISWQKALNDYIEGKA